jgi:phosphoribosylaminoimidazole-succinocarboxamide synthase
LTATGTFTAAAFIRSGKVRDLYAVNADRLLLVASDRISAYDVVLPTPIPDKGKVLTGLSRFWFAETTRIVPNHLVATDPGSLPPTWAGRAPELRGRMLLCRRLEMLPVEVVVRGYLAGGGWKDYAATGAVSGIRLEPGLREGDRLPAPIFTPSTKAESGHDEPISFDTLVDLLAAPGRDTGELAEGVRDVALRFYAHAAAACARAGILLADTKLEMGLAAGDGTLVLADEVLTPDSSRFWDAAAYAPGGPQASFDKQYVRDWLDRAAWDRTDPGPALPDDVVSGTRARYVEAFERITGATFARYLEEDVIAR